MADSIDTFEFIRLHGDILAPAREGAIVMRPGVNGIGAIRTGVRGQPFVLRSLADYPTMDSAHAALILYRSLVFRELVNVIKSDVNYFQIGVKFLVTRVDPIRIQGAGRPVGLTINTNLALGFTFLLEAEWELIAQAI